MSGSTFESTRRSSQHYAGTERGCASGSRLNGDGLPVLAEYAHGLEPLAPHHRAYTRLEPIMVDGEDCLCIRYQVDPAAEPFVFIHGERFRDLADPGGWQRGGTTVASSDSLIDGTGLVEVVSRSLTPMSPQDREFLRFAHEPAGP